MAVQLGLEIYLWVKRLARRLAAKPDAQGIMKIPNQQIVRDLSNDILTKFMKYNVPRRCASNLENEVKVIIIMKLNIWKNKPLLKILSPALTPHKTGDVLDLTGKKNDTSKPISGGKNIPETD